MPASRDLTPLEKVRAMIIDVPKRTPQENIVGLNDGRADLHDVYRLNIATGERMLIRKNDENIAGWMTDLDGKLRLGLRITQTGGTEILQVRGDTLTRIYDVSAEESAGPVRFTPDGKALYLTTNKGTLDKMQLELYDLATGKTALVEQYLVFAGTSPGASDLLSGYNVGGQLSASGALGPGRYYVRVQGVNGVGAGGSIDPGAGGVHWAAVNGSIS